MPSTLRHAPCATPILSSRVLASFSSDARGARATLAPPGTPSRGSAPHIALNTAVSAARKVTGATAEWSVPTKAQLRANGRTQRTLTVSLFSMMQKFSASPTRLLVALQLPAQVDVTPKLASGFGRPSVVASASPDLPCLPINNIRVRRGRGRRQLRGRCVQVHAATSEQVRVARREASWHCCFCILHRH